MQTHQLLFDKKRLTVRHKPEKSGNITSETPPTTRISSYTSENEFLLVESTTSTSDSLLVGVGWEWLDDGEI
jgi:hypothetical protein